MDDSNFGIQTVCIPDRATCLDMLREISEEAYAVPHFGPSPDLTVRYFAVLHWLEERRPLPPDHAEKSLSDGASIAAAIGMWAKESSSSA